MTPWAKLGNSLKGNKDSPMQELKNWNEEKKSVFLYKLLAQLESGSSIGELFFHLAQEAEKQAGIWAEVIRKKGGTVPETYSPELRTRWIAWMLRRFGPRHMRMILAAAKIRGMSVYSSLKPGHPFPQNIQQVGLRHKAGGSSGILRAAVFGINDGLVSNASLILGVAGASAENYSLILLSGIAGLLAGAFSMGAGEYLSMRSQREMFEHQIGLEREELKEYPKEEAAELALIYEAKGLSKEEAQEISEKLIAEPDQALNTLAREELGLNPEQLGSPWGATLSSFSFFAIGAMIPLCPFLFLTGHSTLWVSILFTGAALFLVGAALSLFTGKRVIGGGLRMLVIGGGAGAATFFIGKLLGVGLN
jgi:VIT1/CCC1 family predicted Fe2+/Mn2+ transporter